MTRVLLVVPLLLLVGCPTPPAEPTTCDRLRNAVEARRARCLEPAPEEPVDCSAVTLRDPASVNDCVAELDSVRCDEPLSSVCEGQFVASPR